MSEFGLFEASVSSEQEQQLQQREAADKLNAAIYDVKDKFGQFLFGARDLEGYHDRLALCKNDILKAIEPHLFPRTGVVRRVLKPIEREFKASLVRQADGWGVPTTTRKEDENPSPSGPSDIIGPGADIKNKSIMGPGVSAPKGNAGGYTVQPGDTLSGIAEQHGVNLADLEKANPQYSSNWDLIHPNESVNIPGKTAPSPAPVAPGNAPLIGGGGPTPPPSSTLLGPVVTGPGPAPTAPSSLIGPGADINRKAVRRTAVDDNDPNVSASTAPTPSLGIDQMGAASGAAAPSQAPAPTGAFGTPAAPLSPVPVGGRRARQADKTGPAMDLDITYSPSDDDLIPEGDFKGYLRDVSQGAEEKVDRNFGGTFPGGQSHDEVAHFAAWCRRANVRPSLSALDRYNPTDRAYFAIAAALQRYSADIGDPNAIIPNAPIQQGLAGEGAQAPQPNSVAVPAAAGVAQGTPGIIRQQKRQACYPGCDKNEKHVKKYHNKDKEARRSTAELEWAEGYTPSEEDIKARKRLRDPESGRLHPGESWGETSPESYWHSGGPEITHYSRRRIAGFDNTKSIIIEHQNAHDIAQRSGRPDDHEYVWQVGQELADRAYDGDKEAQDYLQHFRTKDPGGVSRLRSGPSVSPGRPRDARVIAPSRRRTAAPNYLQKADEALTNLLNQKAEEFQTSVAPLQQALQTVQQAEQLEQQANPLNVVPPAGTVNVLPQAAGADQQQVDPNAIAALVNGGGEGVAPPTPDQGAPPAAGDQGALPPELAQQLQAARIGPRMLTAAMSHRRYAQIADIVAGLPGEHKSRVAPALADMFKSYNPRFSRDKFFAAVGLQKRGGRPKGLAATRRQAAGTHPPISAKDSCQTCWNNSAERGGSNTPYIDLIKANHHEELVDHFRHDQYLDQQRHPQREHKRGPGRHTDRAAAVLDEWNQWLQAQPPSRGDEGDIEQFAQERGHGPRAVKRLREQLYGPQHLAAAAGPEEDLWWTERGDPHPEHDRARWRREVNPYAEDPEATHPKFRHLRGLADLGAPTQKANGKDLRYSPYDPHATARWWERRYLSNPQQFVSTLHNPDHAENFFPFLAHDHQGQLVHNPDWPRVRVYDENTARWARKSQRKQAWMGWSPIGESSRHHKVAGWKWDSYLNGYTTTAADKFSCKCGEEHDTPSYHECKCGKVWNSTVIGSGSGREASLEKVICREVPMRRDMIVANKKKRRADLTYDLDKSIHDEQTAQDEYTDFASDAERSGRPEAADRYREVRKDEVQHEKEFRDLRGMRKGAPFAGYEDFAACEEENADKRDSAAYCGEIKHRVEDKKKAAWDRDTGWANRGVDEDQLGNTTFSYSDELKPVKPKPPPKMNKPPADWHRRTPDGRWTGYAKRHDITRPGGTPDEEGEDSGEPKPKSMPPDWHHRDQNQRWTK